MKHLAIALAMLTSVAACSDDRGTYVSGISRDPRLDEPQDTESREPPAQDNWVDARDGGTTDPTGGNLGSPSEPPVIARLTLEHYVGPQIWTQLKRTIAVHGDTLYVTNGSSIFVVEDGTPQVWLKSSEIEEALSQANLSSDGGNITSLDCDAQGVLYFMHARSFAVMLASSQQGEAQVLRDHEDDPVRAAFPQYMSVLDAGHQYFVARGGLLESTDEGLSVIYDEGDLVSPTSCPGEALIADRQGFLFYAPGCPDGALLGGPRDGSGFGILLPAPDQVLPGGFEAMGRDAPDGVVVSAAGRLLHVGQDGSFGELVLSPSLSDYGAAANVSVTQPALARGASGTVYVLLNQGTPAILRAR